MRYLGMDVHAKSTVWCLLNGQGEVLERGRVATSTAALMELTHELTATEELLVGQEVGTMAYLVHDAITAAGVRILSFNAYQLRMIVASRKKTDRRDAYWIAKALQAGMYPHPVYIPSAPVRELRVLLSQRRVLKAEQNRWRYRARTVLRAAGCPAPTSPAALDAALGMPVGSGPTSIPLLPETLALYAQQERATRRGLREVEARLQASSAPHNAIARLMTIPGIGPLAAATIYAWVGDVRRFPNAKALGAYAGLVPTVRQSGSTQQVGAITKEGAKPLRATLIQAAHVVLHRCRSAEAVPLQRIGERLLGARSKRRKIVVVAMARHLLRLAYYLLRDGTTYDATRVSANSPTPVAA
ncbi:MAG TPA: IS110 family transposase [Methylomirabilota bacterium]|jgi:transposase|nr:IS110 family transposase [Methylomirabilota bacterium]